MAGAVKHSRLAERTLKRRFKVSTGLTLMDYLQNEFRYYFGRAEYAISKTPRRVTFWARLVEENG